LIFPKILPVLVVKPIPLVFGMYEFSTESDDDKQASIAAIRMSRDLVDFIFEVIGT
jgi:hypothetical protein